MARFLAPRSSSQLFKLTTTQLNFSGVVGIRTQSTISEANLNADKGIMDKASSWKDASARKAEKVKDGAVNAKGFAIKKASGAREAANKNIKDGMKTMDNRARHTKDAGKGMIANMITSAGEAMTSLKDKIAK